METFWFTDQALSDGVQAAQGWIEVWGGRELVKRDDETYLLFGFGSEVHRTRAEAVTRAEAMRVTKIASLRRQIAKLEAMTFEEDAA